MPTLLYLLNLVINNSKSSLLVLLPRDQWYRRDRSHKDSLKFWTFTMALTLKKTIQFLRKTLLLTIIYHPITTFGSKKISSSADMVETVISDYMSTHCDLDLKDSKPIFLHDTGPWWWITIPSLVTEGSAVEEKSSGWTFTKIWTFSVSLILTTIQQSNLLERLFS